VRYSVAGDNITCLDPSLGGLPFLKNIRLMVLCSFLSRDFQVGADSHGKLTWPEESQLLEPCSYGPYPMSTFDINF